MGTCSNLIRPKHQEHLIISIKQRYSREAHIEIKKREIPFDIIEKDIFNISLTDPVQLESESIKILTLTL